MMGRKLVLTGVTCNPGRVLIEYLAMHRAEIQEQYPGGIHVILRKTSDTAHLDAHLPDAVKIICDLTDTDGLTGAFRGMDTVFHIAGIHWSREVAAAAARCGVRRLIAVHTCGIYSRYRSIGESYRETDRIVYNTCRGNGILLTVLRPAMIYGCGRDRNLILMIRIADRLPLIPAVQGGRYCLQPVHYADLGKAFYDVLTQEEQTAGRDFILSGDRPVQLREIFFMICTALGKKPRFIYCPFWVAYSGAWLWYLLSMKKQDYREKVQRLCEPRAYGYEAASETFGFQPRQIEFGITDEVKEYVWRKEKKGNRFPEHER